MTVIRPNSISGITSITAQANEINVFKSDGTLAGLSLNGVNVNTTTGISTYAALNVTGNISIGGTLTYQDVTNVDSLGIGTFRAGIDVSGGQLDLDDNIKIRLGTGNDLEIYHDSGGNSHIKETGGGSLVINADDFYLQNNATTTFLRTQSSGAIELYHNGTKQLETDSLGINVDGRLDVVGTGANDHLNVGTNTGRLRLGGYADLQLFHDSSNINYIQSHNDIDLHIRSTFDDSSQKVQAKFIHNGAVELFHNGNKKFETTNLGTQTFGDAQFEGNDGTDNQLKWDKSDDSLYFRDNVKAQFGTGGDLQLYHDGNNSFIENAGTGSLNLYGDEVNILNKAKSEFKAKFITDGAVELYHNNSLKVQTISNGFQNYGSGNGNGSYHFINATANLNRHVEFSFQRIGGSNRGTTAIIYVGENGNAQGEVIIASSGSNGGVSGGVIMNNGATSFSSNSDTRLKNKISDITDALTNIKQIDTWKYSWKDDTSNTPKLGVTAQSVQSVYPEVVGKRAKLKDNSDPTEYLNVAYTELIPVCIAAIKELSAEVDTLKTKVAELGG